MNTTSRASELLQQSLNTTRDAQAVITDLIAAHDYQDVAILITQAAVALLESAALLMQSQGEAAFDEMDKAEDFLDAVYEIINGELDED